ncbi:M20 family metallopeptidase [Saccharothrix deserti]|uniref:M20 family metallopeptidase n=1 Tax=Saccharothrix deserti TaxID=2593674 RepID=UPI00131D8CE5|nr:M20 family metallopeptidase [Saccharothrix deserti]
MSAKSLSAWCRDSLGEQLADISELVGHESPSTGKALLDTAADWIEGWLHDRLGPPAEWTRREQDGYGDVLEATYPGTPGEPVLLIGHYDTVWPEGTLDDWPFTVHDGTATGPGVYDMKAGLVTGVWALRALRDLDLPHPTVKFLFNGDEELGSPVSRPHIENAARESAAAFVLEPGVGWDVKTERKGVGTFTISTTGIESHAGNEPSAGASAVHALSEIVGRLIAAADPDAGTTINVGTIDGGTARNVIAGRARCLVDVRITHQAEADRVDRVLAGLQPADPRVTVTVGGGWSRPPMRLTPASKDLFDLADEIATELRGPLEPISVGGGSDANFVAALGVPVLDGLGSSGAGGHARHEHILVDHMPERIALVAALLRRLGSPARH